MSAHPNGASLIWLVHEQRLHREALRRALEAQQFRIIVRAFDRLPEPRPVRLARHVAPETLVINLGIGRVGPDSANQLSEARRRANGAPILLIVNSPSLAEACAALQSGASGCVDSSQSMAVLASAIHVVGQGGLYLPADILRTLAMDYAGESEAARHEIGSAPHSSHWQE